VKRSLSLVALVCVLAVSLPGRAAAASYTSSASATPGTVARGASVALSAVVQTDTAQSLLVDLEVYHSDGRKVFQQWWDSQSFAAGQRRTYQTSWSVPADAAVGTYTVMIGLFSPGWGTLHHWNSRAGQLSIATNTGGGGGGTGLLGQYYDNSDFTNLKLTRTDARVDFNWGDGQPASAIGRDTFSVRWQGTVKPRFTETYTFYTVADDGVRLWVNGQQLINDWTIHPPTERSGSIQLNAEQAYDIKLEYFEQGGGAVARLLWSSPSQQKQVIPQDRLFASTTSGPTATSAPTAPPTTTPVPATATAAPATATPAPAGRYFSTLPPGSPLPSDAECAAAVKRRPENKGMNRTYNATRGNQSLPSDFYQPAAPLVGRVTGNFTGTTDEILQWAACKWGVDEDLVRAQAAVESWWTQTAKGDWASDPTHCAPGHGIGADGRPGECPNSWGILQNRYSPAAWPGLRDSTAFNADTAYMIWRTCYEGYEGWLNTVERGRDYGPGDALGCMGRWFSGRWYNSAATGYMSRVQEYKNGRIWEQPNFQQP
jgi:hypothetical protein